MHATRFPAALVCLGLILSWLATPARAESVEIDQLRLCFAGHARHGHWAELQCTLMQVSKGKHLLPDPQRPLLIEAISRDGDGTPVAYSVEAPAKFPQQLQLPIKLGPPKSTLTLRVSQGDMLLAEQPLELSTGETHRSVTELYGILGADTVGITSAMEWMQREKTGDRAVFNITSAAELPEHAQGYEALERLCVVLGAENPLAHLSPTQRTALEDWVARGGKLCLAFTSGFQPPNATEFPVKIGLPGPLSAAEPLLSETGLKTFAVDPLPFELAQLREKPVVFPLDVPRQFVLQGESGTAANDRPLVMEKPFGFGRLTCVLVDLSHPQLAQWSGRPKFWGRVLSGKSMLTAEAEVGSTGGRVTHRGYQDLTGQLRSALDQYEQVTPIHFYAVAGAMLAYLLILGPGEYLLLNRISRQNMQVTWFILPVLVLGVVAGSIWMGRQSHGTTERMNHVELLDLDTTTGNQRGWFWTGIFSPSAVELTLTATPLDANILPADTEFSWQALPGTGLGGVDTPSLAAVTPNRYRVHGSPEEDAKLFNLPLNSGSSKLLTGNWWGTFTPGENCSRLQRGKIKDFEGSFRNVAPFALKQAYIAHGEYLYKAADDLAPGATINVDRLKRLHLESYLIRRTSIASNDLTTPWNGDDTDVPRILEMMLFHEASGGENYTELANRYQHDLDLSRLLKQGYAVLLGRVADPLVQVQEASSPLAPNTTRRWSFVRIIYPVAPRSETPSPSN